MFAASLADPQSHSPVLRVGHWQARFLTQQANDRQQTMAKKAGDDPYADYEIREEHATSMLAMLGMIDEHGNEGELPAVVRRKYIEGKILADRNGQHFNDYHLWVIALTAGPVQVEKKPPPTVAELWKAKKIRAGDPVLYTLGEQQNLEGLLITVTKDRIKVQAADGEERSLEHDKVNVS